MPALQVSPIVAALDHPEVTLDRETVPAVALSLVDAFAQVPDPRTRLPQLMLVLDTESGV